MLWGKNSGVGPPTYLKKIFSYSRIVHYNRDILPGDLPYSYSIIAYSLHLPLLLNYDDV